MSKVHQLKRLVELLRHSAKEDAGVSVSASAMGLRKDVCLYAARALQTDKKVDKAQSELNAILKSESTKE